MKGREFPFMIGSDPVRFDLLCSLGRPYGAATGITLFSSTLSAKRRERLREVVPGATFVAPLMNPAKPNLGLSISHAALLRADEVIP